MPDSVSMTTLQIAEFAVVAVAAVMFCILTVYLAIKLKREKKAAEKRIKTLEKELKYDYLTGALSRRAFIKDMEEALAQNEEGTLLVFDINSFKTVNEMYGHTAGDGLIKRYAARLIKAFDRDIVGRIEGDDFAVFVSGKCSKDDINSRIKKSGAARFPDKQTQLQITSCCGAAAAPKNGRTFAALYENADKALHYSKKNEKTISYCRDDDGDE